jgi:hypothetical protein
VPALADRYAGRHIRQARHGAWATKKRTRSKPAQLVPTAAAFTVAGVLIGGAGTVIQLASPAMADEIDSPSYDAAGYPPTDGVTNGGWARQTDTDATKYAAMTAANPTPAAVNRPTERASNAPITGIPVPGGASTTTPSIVAPVETPTGDSPTETLTDPTVPDRTAAVGDDPSAGTEGSCSATPAASAGEQDAGVFAATSSTLPNGAEVLVTNEATEQSVVVVVTSQSDSGCLSLSPAAFAEIAPLGTNVVDVHFAVLVEDAT